MVIQFDSSWESNAASPCSSVAEIVLSLTVFCQFGAKLHIILEMTKGFGRKKSKFKVY